MHNTSQKTILGWLGGAAYLDGRVYDVLVTNDVLTPSEVSNIDTYFQTGTYPGGDTDKGFNKFNGIEIFESKK